MQYRAIGLMSGSSLDGLDIVFAELHQDAGKWSFEIVAADCYSYEKEWSQRLSGATALSALEYQQLHVDYGHYLGSQVNRFISNNDLTYKVGLVASHGHTTFHVPAKKMTAQLGDGAAIAAVTKLPVVSDLRALDIAFGGQGAPIVPIGEKLLFPAYSRFLNLGGIANISFSHKGSYTAYDVCPANRVFNMLAAKAGKEFDDGGRIAASGVVNEKLLQALNDLDYYKKHPPKSLANEFGTDKVFPMITSFGLSLPDSMRTYLEHVVMQIAGASMNVAVAAGGMEKLLVTGGGAFNSFLIERLREELEPQHIQVEVPDDNFVQYKEALVMALIGVLRWRQEYNVLSSVTGAERDSIGGALWNGQEA